jgi:dihydrolipoamide dehydrogenase
MSDRFDAVVLGMGPGGEVVADRLIQNGMKIAVVERELIGGECAYWACIPSKTLLRPVAVKAEARRAAGTESSRLDWKEAASYRDYMIRHLDDTKQVLDYEERGATVLKGKGRVVERGVVEVQGRRLAADHVVLATGSDTEVPAIRGLSEVSFWTNREATTLGAIPRRVVLLGGGPVGIELGQMLARFGAEVVLVQAAPRLLNREEPRVGELVRVALEADAIDVRVGHHAVGVRRDGTGIRLDLDDDSEVAGDVLVIGAGRRPRTVDLGLEAIGLSPDNGRLAVDDRCRLAEGLWAVGDVTGVELFTHVAKYQGRIAAANILGRPIRADYRSIPRVVFSDPEVAAVGLSEEEARARGIDVATATVELADAIARPWTYERDPRGELKLIADRRRKILIGAWAVAPLAGEWIHQAVLAIRAETPLEILLDTVAQFPTYTESFLKGLERLEI